MMIFEVEKYKETTVRTLYDIVSFFASVYEFFSKSKKSEYFNGVVFRIPATAIILNNVLVLVGTH